MQKQMERDEFLKILSKYREGRATREEENFLFAYYNLFELGEDILEELDTASKDKLKASIKEEIDKQIAKHETLSEEPVNISRKPYSKWLAAAMITLLSVAAGYFGYNRFYKQDSKKELLTRTQDEKITPGKNDAVLTLSDGSIVILNNEKNGLITHQAGVSVVKSKDGQLVYEVEEQKSPVINTISTPKGGQYQLILADGTKVWLNAASSIKFPTSFKEKERIVEITGEAYFEVAKDVNKPFKVFSERQVIEVLGTAFNVNTYKDEVSDKTTLLEGSVKIARINGKRKEQPHTAKILKPGQQSLVTGSHSNIILREADLNEAIAWKEGYFKFNKADIQTVMRQIARWYNVEVEYKGELSKDLFAGEINRSEDVRQVLRILELSKVNIAITGRTIIISN